MVKVALIEFEKGWGSRVDEIREFDTKELAESFIWEFNSKNTAEVTPDWYMVARLVNEQ